jgi:hypothetical protein
MVLIEEENMERWRDEEGRKREEERGRERKREEEIGLNGLNGRCPRCWFAPSSVTCRIQVHSSHMSHVGIVILPVNQACSKIVLIQH